MLAVPAVGVVEWFYRTAVPAAGVVEWFYRTWSAPSSTTSCAALLSTWFEFGRVPCVRGITLGCEMKSGRSILWVSGSCRGAYKCRESRLFDFSLAIPCGDFRHTKLRHLCECPRPGSAANGSGPGRVTVSGVGTRARKIPDSRMGSWARLPHSSPHASSRHHHPHKLSMIASSKRRKCGPRHTKPAPDPVVARALSNLSAAVRAGPTPEWASAGAEWLRVLVLASSRVHLLEQTLGAVFRWGPANRTNVTVWIDLNQKGAVKQSHVVHVVRECALRAQQKYEVVVFQRHAGTRSMWLAALHLPGPLLILEDDVVVQEGAYQWYCYALRAMAANPDIAGASLAPQTTVAGNAGRKNDAILRQGQPFLYPLVGSHGFILSPHYRPIILDFLEHRPPASLRIDGIRTTEWYCEFQAKNLTSEQMWTQELVAFAYHYRRYFLFSAHRTPFAVHCGTLHGIDVNATANQGLGPLGQGKGKGMPKDVCGRDAFARQDSRYSDADSDIWQYAPSEIPVLGWDTRCLRHCDRVVPVQSQGDMGAIAGVGWKATLRDAVRTAPDRAAAREAVLLRLTETRLAAAEARAAGSDRSGNDGASGSDGASSSDHPVAATAAAAAHHSEPDVAGHPHRIVGASSRQPTAGSEVRAMRAQVPAVDGRARE